MSYDAVTLPATCGICDYLTYDPHSVNGILVCPTCAKELNDAAEPPEPPTDFDELARLYDDFVSRVLAEKRALAEMSHAIACPRCQVELGDGRFQCPRAKSSDLCLSCALEMDPPTDGPYELSENEL